MKAAASGGEFFLLQKGLSRLSIVSGAMRSYKKALYALYFNKVLFAKYSLRKVNGGF